MVHVGGGACRNQDRKGKRTQNIEKFKEGKMSRMAKKTVQWSAHDTKAAHFQEAQPTCNNNVYGTQEIPTLLASRGLVQFGSSIKKNWHDIQRGNSTKMLWKTKGACADVHRTKFFKGNSPLAEANTSKPTPIFPRVGCRLSTVVLPCAWWLARSSLSARIRKTKRQTKNSWTSRPCEGLPSARSSALTFT